MNLPSLFILLVTAVLLVLAARYMLKPKNRTGCSGCTRAGNCQAGNKNICKSENCNHGPLS